MNRRRELVRIKQANKKEKNLKFKFNFNLNDDEEPRFFSGTHTEHGKRFIYMKKNPNPPK